jgi:hypothetical protein
VIRLVDLVDSENRRQVLLEEWSVFAIAQRLVESLDLLVWWKAQLLRKPPRGGLQVDTLTMHLAYEEHKKNQTEATGCGCD